MNTGEPENKDHNSDSRPGQASENDRDTPSPPAEIGGRNGPDPTRYGDWEKGGRCIDF